MHYMTFPPLLIFQSLQQAQIQLFSLLLSHSHFPTHTHISCASRSALVQTACQSVCQIGPRNRSHTLIHTHTVWITVGNIRDGFPRNVLACLRNVSLLSSPLSLSLLFPFLLALQAGVGVKRENDNMPVFELYDLDWVSSFMKMKQYPQPISLL